MCKCVLLFILFVALVPGVLVTINLGFKNKMVPVLIHGAILAVIYSCLSHAHWVYKQKQQQKMMRRLNSAIMDEIQLDQLATVQMNQMVQNDILSELATKCTANKA